MTNSFPSIFTECQRSIGTHKKCIAAATKLLLTNKSAVEEFISCVDRILVVDKRHPAVERCVTFVANLIAAYSTEITDDRKPLWSPLLGHLLEKSNVKDASVRFRTCQIIAETMSLLPEDVEIDDELWDDLCEKMILRTKDKAAITRSYAVRALARLQDPSESDNPVIVEYIRLLSTDPTKEVRKAVLTHMGISKKTLPHILQRSRDLSDEIRKETYQIIGRKVDIRALTIAQRQQLLEGGLQDRSDDVRKAVVAMTAGWLGMEVEGPAQGIEWLLRSLDVENDGEPVARLVIQELYKAELLQLPKLDLSELSSETALLWRVMCELWKEHKDAQLESLPELSQLCHVIQAQSSKFAVRQLIQLSKFVDLADEVGRRNLNALICQMLCNLQTPLEYITPLLELLHSFHTAKDFASLALEIISELRYPLYAESEASKPQETKTEDGTDSEGITSDEEDTHKRPNQKNGEEELRSITQVRLQELNKQLTALASKHPKKRTTEAKRADEELRASLENEKDQLEEILAKVTQQINQREELESKIWCQSLDVVLFLLQNTKTMKEHTGIMEIHAVMLSKALRHAIPVVRVRGVCCTVLYCLLDYSAARAHVPTFLELLHDDLPAIQLTVIKGLFDLIAYFGSPMLEDSDESKDGKLLSLLSSYLLHDDEDFRFAAVEGFAKLFMADITTSAMHFTHLVLLFFNPTTTDDLELRQCLSLFFSAFACCNRVEHVPVIQAAFIPTMKTITNAPSSSPIKKIQLLHAAQFLLTLLDNSNSNSNTNNSADHSSNNHTKLAAELAHEILACPKENKELCKVLNYFSVTEDDQDLVKIIAFLVGEIQEQKAIQQDKLISKGLAKFSATLKRVDKSPDALLTPSRVGKIRDKIKLISDNMEKELSDPEVPKPKKLQRKPQNQPQKKSQKAAYISDSESSNDTESSDEEEEEEELVRRVPVRAPSTRRANLAAKNKMKDLSSSESESDEQSAESCEESDSTNDSYNVSKNKAPTKKPVANTTKDRDQSASDSETDTESEMDPPASEPSAPLLVANRHKPVSKNESESESESGNESKGDLALAKGNSAAFPTTSLVRQVSLYDSSDEDSASDHAESSSSDRDLSDKENQPENTPVSIEQHKTPLSTEQYKTPLGQPKSHSLPTVQPVVPGMDTSKKQRCLELDQEIGNLLDGHDPKQTLMQKTVLEVSKLLQEDILPPSQSNSAQAPAKATTNPSKQSIPLRVSPKGATIKVQPHPSKITSASSTTIKPQIPLHQRQVQQKSPPSTVSSKPSISRVSSVASKPLGTTSKAPATKAPSPVTGSVKSPPALHTEKPPRLSVQPTAAKPRASLLSSSNKPLPPSSKPRAPIARKPAGQTAH